MMRVTVQVTERDIQSVAEPSPGIIYRQVTRKNHDDPAEIARVIAGHFSRIAQDIEQMSIA